MNTEKFIVRLSDEERQELETIVKKLKGTSQKVNRALVLLHADCREILRRLEFVYTPVHGSWLQCCFFEERHWCPNVFVEAHPNIII